jgi:hypothetical protein
VWSYFDLRAPLDQAGMDNAVPKAADALEWQPQASGELVIRRWRAGENPHQRLSVLAPAS